MLAPPDYLMDATRISSPARAGAGSVSVTGAVLSTGTGAHYILYSFASVWVARTIS